jgi:hypothetical protein
MNVFRIDIEQSSRSAQASAARGGSINAAGGVIRRHCHIAQLLASPQGCGMFVLQTYPALAGMNPIGFCLTNLSRLCGVKPMPPNSGIGAKLITIDFFL